MSRVMLCTHACMPCCSAPGPMCSLWGRFREIPTGTIRSSRPCRSTHGQAACRVSLGPGMLMGSEYSERKNLRTRNYDRTRTEHRIHTYTTMHSTPQATATTCQENKHEHTHARENSMNLSLTYLNICRGPFAIYSGSNRFTTVREALKAGVLLEKEGQWQVCCKLKGATAN